MLVFAEIAIDAVFVAALFVALGCLAYLVALAVRERHLHPGLDGRSGQTAWEPSPVSHAVERVHPRRAVLHRG